MNNLKYLDFILKNIKDTQNISYKTLQEKINVKYSTVGEILGDQSIRLNAALSYLEENNYIHVYDKNSASESYKIKFEGLIKLENKGIASEFSLEQRKVNFQIFNHAIMPILSIIALAYSIYTNGDLRCEVKKLKNDIILLQTHEKGLPK
mgnify:FL=1